jgi:hypothetical protein
VTRGDDDGDRVVVAGIAVEDDGRRACRVGHQLSIAPGIDMRR